MKGICSKIRSGTRIHANIMYCRRLKVQIKAVRQEKILRNIRIGWKEMKLSLASIYMED